MTSAEGILLFCLLQTSYIKVKAHILPVVDGILPKIYLVLKHNLK